MALPAATAGRYENLASIGRRLNPDGSVAQVIEILDQSSPILQHIPMKMGNQPAGDRTTIRTGLPKGVFTTLYGGVQPTRGDYAQITESTAMLKSYSRFDCDLEDFVDDMAALRMQEDRGHVEGMGQQMARAIMYSDENRYDKQFMGLTPRFNDKSAANGDNIIDASIDPTTGNTRAGFSTTDLASIWIIGWGMDSVCGIYPKNAKQGGAGGLSVIDHPKQISENVGVNDGLLSVYTTEFKWHMGICLRDWRNVVRICNIPRNLLRPNPSQTDESAANIRLYDLYHRAITEYVSPVRGRTCIYADKFILSILGAQLSYATAQSTLMEDNVGGHDVVKWRGREWYRLDALAVAESRVT